MLMRNPFNFLKKKGQWVHVSDLKKKMQDLEATTDRPDMSYLFNNYTTNSVSVPFFPQRELALYEMVRYSDVLRTIHIALKGEIFRNGFEIELKKDKEEDENELQKIDNYIMFPNHYDESLVDVFNRIEDDFNTIDRGYMIFLKEYGFNAAGEIVEETVKEIIRGDPLVFEPIRDIKGRYGYDKDGKAVYVSLSDRKNIFSQPGVDENGRQLRLAHFKANNKDGASYYIKGEVVYRNKYTLDGYGFSPVYSIWQKITTLFTEDKYLREYFQRQRPPKGMLFVNTRSQEKMKKAWDWLLNKLRLNPHMIYPMSVDSGSTRGQVAQFLKFFDTLPELEFTQHREEFRRAIGAFYGVSPVFQNDVSTSGGLNNEGLQITVTNRAVERGQKPYNEHFLQAILDAFGIENYTLKLKPSEEKDEAAEIQRESQRILNAQNMKNMGFTVEINDESDELDFTYSGEASAETPLPGETPFDSKTPEGLPGLDSTPSGTPEASKALADGAQRREASEFMRDFDKDVKIISNKIKSLKRYKGTERDNKISGIINDFEKKINKSARLNIRNIYLGAISLVEKELDANVVLGSALLGTEVNKILNSPELNTAIKNTTDQIKLRTGEVIQRSIFETIDEKEIITSLKSAVAEADSNLTNIARTETSKIVNTARLKAYEITDPEDEKKYKWIGPMDHRTTDVCENIKRRTAKGVSRDELLDIMEQEALNNDPNFNFNRNEPTPHFQCRHVPVRLKR